MQNGTSMEQVRRLDLFATELGKAVGAGDIELTCRLTEDLPALVEATVHHTSIDPSAEAIADRVREQLSAA